MDEKSEVKVEKHPLVVELKLKMVSDAIFTLSISALQKEVIFQMSVHFLHLWTLCQKIGPQNFERLHINKNIELNVKEGSILGILHS